MIDAAPAPANVACPKCGKPMVFRRQFPNRIPVLVCPKGTKRSAGVWSGCGHHILGADAVRAAQKASTEKGS